MKLKVRQPRTAIWVKFLFGLFAHPAIAMVCWGAFVEMSGFDLPKLGYWAFFMLNLIASALIRSGDFPYELEIKEED